MTICRPPGDPSQTKFPYTVLVSQTTQHTARPLAEFLTETCRGQYTVLQVYTGDSPTTIPFYEPCGFRRHHLVKNFFTDHYDHPLYECEVRLVDMVYLQKDL